MNDTVKLTIDGRTLTAARGATILDAAREANILIPSLCHHPELQPYGACRLCMVEITQKKRRRMVASCIFEVAQDLVVETRTEPVLNVRRLVIELLLARNPRHPALLKIAADLGVAQSRFDVEVKGCILCGQCVRTCREVVGVAAIGYSGRGPSRKVTTPFNQSPVDCIACGSCAYICPVDVIPLKEEDGVRTIWKTPFPMQKCEKCGSFIAPVKQLEYFRDEFNLPEKHFSLCHLCR
jgi:bidirectional [NiFe] hydrogenase diaphorase subunit